MNGPAGRVAPTGMQAAGAAWDAIVIGGGHNGLVCAAYLGRAGLRTLVLERRATLGGAAGTSELAPGYRVPTLAHTVGRLRPSLVRELGLHEHGLALIAPEVRVFAPQPDGRAVTLWGSVERTAEELAAWSAADAAAYPSFDALVRRLGAFFASLHASTPPDTGGPDLGDAFNGLVLGRAFRGLGRDGRRTVLRVLPMAVADFVRESFDCDPVAATIAARGVLHTAMGVWSMGTTAVLLADSAAADAGAAGQTVFARGGPGALADALEAVIRVAGGELRRDSEVIRVTTDDGRATGVALASGEEIAAPIVASGIDPKRTLLDLLDPVDLGPERGWRAGNLRTPGTVAKVNLALSALPHFPAAGDGTDEARRLRGRILVNATGIDALERAFDAAKWGGVSDTLVLEATIPSLVDRSLVVGAPDGAQVMSVVGAYAPYALADGAWDDAAREALGDRVVATLETVAPGIGGLVVARQVLTPVDLEREFGLTGGHPYHLEPSLDQWFAWRPMLGLARYRLPVAGLYLCGSGAHPGGGVTGGPGANAAREILADRRWWRRSAVRR